MVALAGHDNHEFQWMQNLMLGHPYWKSDLRCPENFGATHTRYTGVDNCLVQEWLHWLQVWHDASRPCSNIIMFQKLVTSWTVGSLPTGLPSWTLLTVFGICSPINYARETGWQFKHVFLWERCNLIQSILRAIFRARIVRFHIAYNRSLLGLISWNYDHSLFDSHWWR